MSSEAKKWKGAAWVAIAAAALIPPEIALGLLADTALKGKPGGLFLTLMCAVTGVGAMLFTLMVLYRFRELLNERFAFHRIDALITFLLIVLPIMTLVQVLGRLVSSLGGLGRPGLLAVLPFALTMVFIGSVLGIINIIVGVRLLEVDAGSETLMRPYAILTIVEGACFAVVILAPLGLLLVLADHVLLAMIFFRAGETQPSVEFV